MPELVMKQEFGKYYIVTDYCKRDEDEYLVRMITDNNIKGHLMCRISFEGNVKKLMYEVTNMISLWSEYNNKYIGLDELRNIFEEIQNIYSAGNRHLLDENYYYINPRYMFRDMQSGELKLLYIPGFEDSTSNRYHDLADFLLQRINRKDDCCIQLAYQFYRMSSSETFSIGMYLNVMQKEDIIRKKPEKNNTIQNEVSEYFSMDNDIEFEDSEDINWILPIVLTVIETIAIGIYLVLLKGTVYSIYCLVAIILGALTAVLMWGKNIVAIVEKYKEDEIIMPQEPVKIEEYWGDEETVVLQDVSNFSINENTSGCRLEWNEKGINKSFSLKSFPIVIGKMKEEVDCLIDDSSISRIHAKIIDRNHEWFIFDLNSTNGSIVDGEKLLPGQEKQLYQDSEIVLGNVKLKVVV